MEKMNSHRTGKLWGKKIFQRYVFLHISLEAEIHTILKTWEKLILIVRTTYGKTQTLESYGFLTYFM